MKVGFVGCEFVGSTAGSVLVMDRIGHEIMLVDKDAADAATQAVRNASRES